MFRNNEMTNRGFGLELANGLIVSAQWSAFHYCDNENFEVEGRSECSPSCKTAEVAVIDTKRDKDDQFIQGWPHCQGDSVAGHLTADQVADIIAWAKAQPNSPPERN